MIRALRERSLNEPFELTEVGFCYFAALIEGLRLINERTGPSWELPEHSACALQRFVQTKGNRIIMACGLVDELSFKNEKKIVDSHN